MKKLICAITAALMIFSMAACSSSAESETSVPTETQTEPQQTTTQNTTQPSTAAPEVFAETVLADDENATVKITAIEEDNIWGYTLKVFLENKTDKELMFTVDNVSVNGFMCDPFWAATVAPGMKSNEEISFSDSDFEKNGIKTVESIVFTLRVYDSNDWLADDLINQTYTVTP